MFLGVASGLYGQEEMLGTITFITSNNVYVKFDATDVMKIGDILQFSGGDCLRITDKSSVSIVCSILNDCPIKKGDTVTYLVKTSDEPIDEAQEPQIEVAPVEEEITRPQEAEKESMYKERIRGRITVASYNSFSDVREDRNRLMTRFSLNADHISDSKFSIESNLSYRSISVPSESTYTGRTSIFNIYNLNVRYDATPSLSLTLGRKINPKAYSIGAVDGLQVEKYFGNFYVGAFAGLRPDFEDYGFNSDLLQYGGYVGIETQTEGISSVTTVGAAEQTNAGATDRRFIYFQHNSTIASNFNVYSTVEVDIFRGDSIPTDSTRASKNTRLTNLYLSGRYKFSRDVNVMVSYDSRKRIIYYEYLTQIEINQLLDDDLARQGLRARLNVRPIKTIWLGLSYSKRFQEDSANKSDNIYAYATLSRIPKIGGRLNVSYNMNTSNYLTSNIVSGRYSRELVKSKLNADFTYRMASYSYENRDIDYSQNFYGLGLSYRISRTWQFSFSGEMSQFEDENSYRFYTRLTKRFYSSKKNK